MSILKKLFEWFCEWALGAIQKYLAEKADDKREEKEVDEIIDKTLDPDLGKQLEGVEDAEERINDNV